MMRITLITAVGAIALFILTLELTRRRRLSEKYSILWFATSVAIFGVAAIPGALDFVAETLGIAYAPSALLLVAFVFVLALILHLSMVISRLSAQTARLAQTVAILRAEQVALQDPPSPPALQHSDD
jgi:hypothetical protein